MGLKAIVGGATGGTAFTGSIAAAQVAFGSGVNAFTSSANLTFSDTAGVGSTPLLTVGSGTTTQTGWKFGQISSGFSAIWPGTVATPSGTNYVIVGSNDPGSLILNSATTMDLRIATTAVAQMQATFFAPGSNGVPTLGRASVGWKGLYLDYTNTATVGAVTINKASMRIIIAAGQQTVIVTNSLSTAATHWFSNIASATVDATATSAQVDASTPGQMTVRLNAPCTAQRLVDLFAVNAD